MISSIKWSECEKCECNNGLSHKHWHNSKSERTMCTSCPTVSTSCAHADHMLLMLQILDIHFLFKKHTFSLMVICTSQRMIRRIIIRIRMSFIVQVCSHIRGFCYSDKSSTVQQNDSNRTGHRQQKNNIQMRCTNSKNTIYNTDNYVWGLTCKFEMEKISMCGE